MATNCGNQINCGCQDSFLTTPPAVPTPGACPEAQPCSEVFDAQCVKYTGADIICLQDIVVEQNASVSEALQNIVEYFCTPPTPVSITANNGLTMSTLTNVQLGGTLIQATTIDVQTNLFQFIGTRNTTDVILKISNSGTGGGIYAETTGNNPIGGFCNGNAPGGVFISATGNGIQARSNSNINAAGYFSNYSLLSNNIIDVIEIVSSPSSTTLPAVGIGGAIKYTLPKINGLGNKELTDSNKIISKLTDVAEASINSELIFQGRTGGANLQDLVTFKGDGEVQFHKYGVGTFSNAPAYMLGVDASGNVVEVAL